MSRCPKGRRRRALGGCVLGALMALAALPATAQPTPAEPPPQAAPAPPAKPEPEPAPPQPVTARVVVTEIRDGDTRTRSFLFRKLGDRARIEPATSNDPRFTPETLYDYGRRESYRNLVDDNITFAYRIPTRDRVLAQIQGFMDTPPEEPVYRLEINPDLVFDGHPCTLVLTGFPSPLGRIHALRWVWEARDLDGQAVKVVFPQGDGSIRIVEYRDASGEPFDPALVGVPEGRPVMSGF